MSQLLLHLAFVFVVVGVKIVVALWAIYYLFPSEATCPQCDGETLALQMPFLRRAAGALLFLGQVSLRWCPECTWHGFTRGRPATGGTSAAVPSPRAADRAS